MYLRHLLLLLLVAHASSQSCLGCAAGLVSVGGACRQYATGICEVTEAPIASTAYSCASPSILSGTSCVQSTPASSVLSCPSPFSLISSSCTHTYAATSWSCIFSDVTYNPATSRCERVVCPHYPSFYDGFMCYYNRVVECGGSCYFNKGPQGYHWNDGFARSCSSSYTQATSTQSAVCFDSNWRQAACPAPYSVSGTSCTRTLAATSILTCASGWSLSGPNCFQSAPAASSIVYSCSSVGFTYSAERARCLRNYTALVCSDSTIPSSCSVGFVSAAAGAPGPCQQDSSPVSVSCSVTPTPSPICPTPWLPFTSSVRGSVCFTPLDHGRAVSWDNANSACRSLGGSLASVVSADEWSALFPSSDASRCGLPPPYESNAAAMWMGLTDSGPGLFEAGVNRDVGWRWVSGASPTSIRESAVAWQVGYPKNERNSDCVAANLSSTFLRGYFFDARCWSQTTARYSCCERSAIGTSPTPTTSSSAQPTALSSAAPAWGAYPSSGVVGNDAVFSSGGQATLSFATGRPWMAGSVVLQQQLKLSSFTATTLVRLTGSTVTDDAGNSYSEARMCLLATADGAYLRGARSLSDADYPFRVAGLCFDTSPASEGHLVSSLIVNGSHTDLTTAGVLSYVSYVAAPTTNWFLRATMSHYSLLGLLRWSVAGASTAGQAAFTSLSASSLAAATQPFVDTVYSGGSRLVPAALSLAGVAPPTSAGVGLFVVELSAISVDLLGLAPAVDHGDSAVSTVDNSVPLPVAFVGASLNISVSCSGGLAPNMLSASVQLVFVDTATGVTSPVNRPDGSAVASFSASCGALSTGEAWPVVDLFYMQTNALSTASELFGLVSRSPLTGGYGAFAWQVTTTSPSAPPMTHLTEPFFIESPQIIVSLEGPLADYQSAYAGSSANASIAVLANPAVLGASTACTSFMFSMCNLVLSDLKCIPIVSSANETAKLQQNTSVSFYSVSWTIPVNATPSSLWVLQAECRSIDAASRFGRSQYFSVSSPRGQRNVTIIAPTVDDIFFPGDVVRVMWIAAGYAPDEYVTVLLVVRSTINSTFLDVQMAVAVPALTGYATVLIPLDISSHNVSLIGNFSTTSARRRLFSPFAIFQAAVTVVDGLSDALGLGRPISSVVDAFTSSAGSAVGAVAGAVGGIIAGDQGSAIGQNLGSWVGSTARDVLVGNYGDAVSNTFNHVADLPGVPGSAADRIRQAGAVIGTGVDVIDSLRSFRDLKLMSPYMGMSSTSLMRAATGPGASTFWDRAATTFNAADSLWRLPSEHADWFDAATTIYDPGSWDPTWQSILTETATLAPTAYMTSDASSSSWLWGGGSMFDSFAYTEPVPDPWASYSSFSSILPSERLQSIWNPPFVSSFDSWITPMPLPQSSQISWFAPSFSRLFDAGVSPTVISCHNAFTYDDNQESYRTVLGGSYHSRFSSSSWPGYASSSYDHWSASSRFYVDESFYDGYDSYNGYAAYDSWRRQLQGTNTTQASRNATIARAASILGTCVVELVQVQPFGADVRVAILPRNASCVKSTNVSWAPGLSNSSFVSLPSAFSYYWRRVSIDTGAWVRSAAFKLPTSSYEVASSADSAFGLRTSLPVVVSFAQPLQLLSRVCAQMQNGSSSNATVDVRLCARTCSECRSLGGVWLPSAAATVQVLVSDLRLRTMLQGIVGGAAAGSRLQNLLGSVSVQDTALCMPVGQPRSSATATLRVPLTWLPYAHYLDGLNPLLSALDAKNSTASVIIKATTLVPAGIPCGNFTLIANASSNPFLVELRFLTSLSGLRSASRSFVVNMTRPRSDSAAAAAARVGRALIMNSTAALTPSREFLRGLRILLSSLAGKQGGIVSSATFSSGETNAVIVSVSLVVRNASSVARLTAAMRLLAVNRTLLCLSSYRSSALSAPTNLSLTFLNASRSSLLAKSSSCRLPMTVGLLVTNIKIVAHSALMGQTLSPVWPRGEVPLHASVTPQCHRPLVGLGNPTETALDDGRVAVISSIVGAMSAGLPLPASITRPPASPGWTVSASRSSTMTPSITGTGSGTSTGTGSHTLSSTQTPTGTGTTTTSVTAAATITRSGSGSGTGAGTVSSTQTPTGTGTTTTSVTAAATITRSGSGSGTGAGTVSSTQTPTGTGSTATSVTATMTESGSGMVVFTYSNTRTFNYVLTTTPSMSQTSLNRSPSSSTRPYEPSAEMVSNLTASQDVVVVVNTGDRRLSIGGSAGIGIAAVLLVALGLFLFRRAVIMKNCKVAREQQKTVRSTDETLGERGTFTFINKDFRTPSGRLIEAHYMRPDIPRTSLGGIGADVPPTPLGGVKIDVKAPLPRSKTGYAPKPVS